MEIFKLWWIDIFKIQLPIQLKKNSNRSANLFHFAWIVQSQFQTDIINICWHLQIFHKYFWLDYRGTLIPGTLDIWTWCIGNIWRKQECIPVGCVPPASVVVGGCLLMTDGGVCPGEGVSAWEVYTPCPLHAMIHPPWTEWLTDGCKNITFPQLRLRR